GARSLTCEESRTCATGASGGRGWASPARSWHLRAPSRTIPIHMVKERIQLTVVIGSATPPGRLRRAVEEAAARAESASNGAARVTAPAAQRIPFANGTPADQLEDDTAAVIAALADADAVLFATPVYRGSFTGVLKNLLDHVPIPALEGTPVGIVAMGATPH